MHRLTRALLTAAALVLAHFVLGFWLKVRTNSSSSFSLFALLFALN